MASERPPAFLPRALVALAWVVTFHVITFVVACAWVLVPLFLFPASWPSWIRWLTVAITVGSAFVLLRQTVWLKDPFVPPGKPLGKDEHPRLQALVREVAEGLGTAPPSEIYLVPDASAYAIEVGLLFRRRRVLLLGLGLLNTCTSAELRAAIAHEMAHFIGGDALLAPLLARVRHGLLRLHDALSGGGPLTLPVLLYADVFLRVTQSISREQERWADRAAARLAGADTLGSLLVQQQHADLVHALLLRSGGNVLLAAGFRPRNFYDGLRRFLRSTVHEESRALLEGILAERPKSPYDSHPTLAERLELLRALREDGDAAGAPRRDDDATLARDLLDEPEQVEERLTAVLFENRAGVTLVPVEWDEVASRAVKPSLDEGAKSAREQVARLFGPERARSDEAALRTVLEVLSRPPSEAPESPRYDALAETFRRALLPHVVALLARTLLRRGGELVVEVGRPFRVRLAGSTYDPEALAVGAVEDPGKATELIETLGELPPLEPSRPQLRAKAASADDGQG